MNVIHFKNQKDRLDFLKGNFEEIKPKVAQPTEITPKVADEPKAEKPKKQKKGKKKDDKVQAE